MKKTVSKITRIDNMSGIYNPELILEFKEEQKDGYTVETISTTSFTKEVTSKDGLKKELASFIVITALLSKD